MQNLGRYEIIEQLGAGAMGAVYKAKDPMMGRDVAVKTILSQAIEGPQAADFRDRFFREARAAGRLAHPGIVTVYDVSEHEGTPFLVMEYVAGRTLQSILQTERLSFDRVCDFSIQLAEALDYAHRNGVIHRDIKPANILITNDGRLKVADFGVARLADSQATATGFLLGTPAFMAPEQFTGGHIDGRVDLFATGVIIYWMSTGDKPFGGDSIISVQYKVVNTDPIPPRKLNPAMPRDFEMVILKSLAKDPAERYQTGQELAADLRSLRSGQPTMIRNAVPFSSNDAPTLAIPSQLDGDPTRISSGTTGVTRSTTDSPPAAAQPTVSQTVPVQTAGVQTPGVAAQTAPPRTTNRWLIAAAVLIIFAAGAAAARFRMRLQQQRSASTSSPVSAVDAVQPPAPAPASTATPPPTTPPPVANKGTASASGIAPKPAAAKAAVEPSPAPQSDKITLALTAQERTNVIFQAEGHPTETLSMKAGDSTILQADKQATLIVTNAGALQGKLNGNPVSFGEGRHTGRFLVTPDGIEDANRAVPGLNALVPGIVPIPPDMPDIAGRGNRNAIGQPARQKELAQSPTSVRLLIKSPAIPEFLTLMVRVDNAVLFRRDATATLPDTLDQRPRRFQMSAVPTSPLAEERLLPPGSHQIQVSLLLGTNRFGVPQDVTADFAPGQRQNLLIELVPENERGAGRGGIPRLKVTLQ